MGAWHNFESRIPGQHFEKIKCRGYYSNGWDPDTGPATMQNLSMADFVYSVNDNKILKNRSGSLETLYEKAAKYDRLQYHSNEQVRKLFEQAQVLAALSNDPEKDW